MMRRMVLPVVLALVLSGCGNGEDSLTEYVDDLNALGAWAVPRSEALIAEYWGAAEPTIDDLTVLLGGAIALRKDVLASSRELDPPAQIIELHVLIFGWHETLMHLEGALIDRAAEAAHLDEVLRSPEAEAYYAAMSRQSTVCNDFQTQLDATEAGGAFEDAPWIPKRMTEVVHGFLSCDVYPETLGELFLNPRTSEDP